MGHATTPSSGTEAVSFERLIPMKTRTARGLIIAGYSLALYTVTAVPSFASAGKAGIQPLSAEPSLAQVIVGTAPSRHSRPGRCIFLPKELDRTPAKSAPVIELKPGLG